MSIAVLSQVYDETRRLAIAGSNLAAGDFRLKKLVPPLEKAGEKAPVFAKVAGAIQNVIDSDTKTASQALLELSTLVTAILYTQGKTGAGGKLKAIKSTDFGMPTSDASARVLKPLIESLTTTGSGRLEMIRDAHKRGAFKDLRLVKPAVAAIDDVYAEIGDFVAMNVLPLYGKAILPELRETFDVKGKGGHVRRLRLMHELDPEGTHELVEEALESGSKEMKVAAISCLKGSKKHLSYMLGQSVAKAKEVRQAALNAIATFTDNEVVDTLLKALAGKDLGIAAGPVSQNRSPKLLKQLLEDSQTQFDEMLSTKDKAKRKKAVSRFHGLLSAFVTRDDKKSEAFLTGCFDQRDAIAKVKSDGIDGASVIQKLASLMVRSNSKAAQKQLVDAHESLEPEVLEWAIIAALRTRTPKQVYDLFAPYYLAKPEKKRGRNPVKMKQEVVSDNICRVASGHCRYRHYYDWDYDFDLDSEDGSLTEGAKIDPRWLDAAVKSNDLSVVMSIAQPKHKGAISLLSKTMDEKLKKKGDSDYEMSEVLETMNRIDHPKVVDYFLKALEKEGKGTKRYYYAWWLVHLIPQLPKSAAPKIEALVPSLNERTIDQVIPALEELKKKK